MVPEHIAITRKVRTDVLSTIMLLWRNGFHMLAMIALPTYVRFEMEGTTRPEHVFKFNLYGWDILDVINL